MRVIALITPPVLLPYIVANSAAQRGNAPVRKASAR
jgi:hypothetical protein